MPVAIRSAGPEDAETAFQVQRSSSLAAFAHVYPPERYGYPDDEIRERWRSALAVGETQVLLAERDGLAVGVVCYGPGRLDGFYVVPEEWGGGVAPALHDAVVEAQRKLGCRLCRLWTLEDNPRARRFYERRGWRLDGRRRTVPFPPYPEDVGYALELG